ncbi:hypothetical protein, unknown function [Leishmania tarentolae]|uniref:Uncharacterized protein n=1 Tax=Leishmania tarentolae TaxID=5689 RepID=A0A640KF01_LEITA|nr:hypothetical protein, unknown function [Leishmania tarentolae]
MTSPTYSHASNTSSRRHHTPLLQERSNSLTRRQEMLKLQSGQSTPLRYSTSQQDEGADADAAMPGTVVVCGVRSAFPLIPLDEAQIASGSAILESTSSRSSPSPLCGVPCVRRPLSPTAATLFQRQHSSTGVTGDEPHVSDNTKAAGLPPSLLTRHRATRDTTGRPPPVRPCKGEEQFSEFDGEAGAEERSFSGELEKDDGLEAGDARSATPSAASPRESERCSSEEGTGRSDVSEVIQPFVASGDDASPPSCTERALTSSQVVTACVPAHAIEKTVMAHTPLSRHSTFNADRSLEELRNDQPASVEAHPRHSRHPTQESPESDRDDGEGRRASQPADDSFPQGCHAQLEQAAVSPNASTTMTTHRQSVQTTDAHVSKTDAASATLTEQMHMKTEEGCDSSGARNEARVAHGDVMPGVLRTVEPRLMSASSDGYSRRQGAGKGSIHAGAAEVEVAHSSSWQTQSPRVLSASEARHASRQVVESADPWYTDADQQPSLLRTVNSRSLLGSASSVSGGNSRRNIYGSLVEHHSDSPVQAATAPTVEQASPTTTAEVSADQLPSQCAGAEQRPSFHASRHASYVGTSDGGEEDGGHPSQEKQSDPKGAMESTATGADDCRRDGVDEVPPRHWPHTPEEKPDGEAGMDDINTMQEGKNESEEHQQRHAEEKHPVGAVGMRGSDSSDRSLPWCRPQVQVSALRLHQICSSFSSVHENETETHQDEPIDVHEKDTSTEYISCYDVACQTSQHLLMPFRKECQMPAESRQEASGEDDVGKAGPLDPHYVGTSRWMCAAGICPECHPRKKVKGGSSSGFRRRSKRTWPLAPPTTSGYSAPPRSSQLQRLQAPVRASTAGRNACLPPLRSSFSASTRTHHKLPPASSCQQHVQRAPYARQCNAYTSNSQSGGYHHRRDRYPSPITPYHSGYSFMQELEAQQRQRQRYLQDLQMEQRARRGGTGGAYTPLLLLTSHLMRSKEWATGKEPRSYRYCDLESQQMMVHTGIGRTDFELENYNDTLHGAPLIREEEDEDDEANAVEPWKIHEVHQQAQLHNPTGAFIPVTGSGNVTTTTTTATSSRNYHAHRPGTGSVKTSQRYVLC